MINWHREVPPLTQSEIHEAVENGRWQQFRRELKGMSTSSKLDCLDRYLTNRERLGTIERVHYVRVANYINALLRGGQLVRMKGGRITVQR